uniref:Packaging protein UL32 n=1 Tax=Elephant endotheliotropic herpesvirus 1A TaxID=759753 RepID=A0A866VU72_ELHV1|nr:DNA packaging protein [Elephant endotheliotropic herpesvirus 1A]QOE74934.1 DNA packaging protein [Elephant endotheliotropic herpesvirus 1A]WES72395.1 DNA packaging protein [Elephantid betaherpesvirus 1]WNZ34531.1 DNA packaging protein [Elephant endotheliotropic herpesvirus 1A]
MSTNNSVSTSSFIGFDSTTLRLDDAILNTILSYAHLDVEDTDTEQPALVFEAGFQISTAIRISKLVTIDRPCPICTLVHKCVSMSDHVDWLLDYCLLCYKSCYAPRTALSNVVLGVEFFRLVETRLGSVTTDLFQSEQVTTLDIYIHFHVNRCFAQLNNVCANENTTIAHLQVLRCVLTESKDVPFKKNSISLSKQDPKCNKQYNTKINKEVNFLPLVLYMWGQTSILQIFDDCPPEYVEVMEAKEQLLWSNEEDQKNRVVGPILLAPHPTLAHKNNTTSICLICELLAVSHDTCVFLTELKSKIDNYCQNNLKLVDKIFFVLDELERNEDDTVIDPCIMMILKHVGAIGLYKHFYCDVMCACNINTVNPDVLFGCPIGDPYEMKLEICHANEYLTLYNKETWLVVQLYKAFQTAEDTYKRKTQIRDFIRETRNILSVITCNLIDISFTLDQYV